MNLSRTNKLHVCLALALSFTWLLAACDREPRVRADVGTIEQRYGLAGAYSERVVTDDGTMDATVVPITLSDGRTGQLVIPRNRSSSHGLYLRDSRGLYPVALQDPNVRREDFVRTEPRIVERRVVTQPATRAPKKKRSLEKELLIVGGSAGAGAAIGAIAGGGKGAAIGGISGGVAGLIYDLATRNK